MMDFVKRCPLRVVSRFENGARVCDPQRLDSQGDVLRLAGLRSEITRINWMENLTIRILLQLKDSLKAKR